jgi:hypothetical protein
MRNLTAYVSNTLRQIRAPDTKVFFIGFNKCGTTSLHHMMKGAGIRSVHWQDGNENITEGIEARLDDHSALRKYLSRWTAYSDLISSSESRIVEGNRHFALYQSLFPKAYFILNDRDVDGWLLSRERHARGKFLLQSIAFHGKDKDGVLNIWRQQHDAHRRAVLSHFVGHPRFLHYRIDRDPIERLIEFLSPEFMLRASSWRVHKKTKAMEG